MKIRLNEYWLLFFVAICGAVQAQTQFNATLTGTVIDSESGEELARASVSVSGHSAGIITDDKGRFTLSLSSISDHDSLVVTHLGYKRFTQVVSEIADTTGFVVAMQEEPTLLNEVSVHSQIMAKRYSPQELKEDYVKFYTILEKVHTGLYDYISADQWQILKDSSMQLISEPMTHRAFFKLIAYHIARIRNVHTRHGVTNSWIRKKSDIFPFNLNYIGNKLYVSESLGGEVTLPRGTEILQINGRRPPEIKKMIWPYIPADGYIETGKMAVLNDYFPWFYALFVEEPGSFTIRFKTLAGKAETITMPGYKESFRRLGFTLRQKNFKSPLELNIDERLKAAYFRIEDSSLFKDSLEIYFRKILKSDVKALVIDLRGHGGLREESHVVELYSYLADKPFRIYERMEVKSNDHTVFDKDFTFRPYAHSLAKIKREYFDKLADSGKGYFLWNEDAFMGIKKPASLHYSGKVYILADGRNHSANTDFTSVASALENVMIVGEETGGEYRSYVSGAMFGLVLPNSKIGAKVPTWKSVLAIEEKPSRRGRGVMPDIKVTQSLEDFVKDRDTVKEFVFDLIQKENAKAYE